MKWHRVSISSIAEINPSIPKKYIPASSDEVTFLSMSAVGEDGLLDASATKAFRSVSKGYTQFCRNDVLLAKITPCMENGKATVLSDIPTSVGCGSTEFHVIRANEDVYPRYLFHLIWNEPFRHLAARNMTGSAGQKRVPKSFLQAVKIPLPFKNGKPDLDEQKRIAAILDKADAIRRKRRQALQLTDDFLRSLFLDMFGDPVTNPKGWDRVTLKQIIKVSSGKGLTAKMMTGGGLHPVYGGNGINGYHDEYMFEDSTIILGRVGAYCGAVHLTEPKSWVTDNALYVRKLTDGINSTYLMNALKFLNLNQHAGRAAQPLISGSRIYPIEINMPPERLQNKYDQIVTSVSRIVTKSESLKVSDLFASLQQGAFAGEL